MDIFDEGILSALKDGQPRLFTQLLDEVGFSHNTLKLYIKNLLKEGVLAREKIASEGLGRPRYVYAVSPKVKKQVSAALADPSMGARSSAVQPAKTSVHVRERRVLQGSKQQLQLTKLPTDTQTRDLKPFLAKFRNKHARDKAVPLTFFNT